MIQKIIAADSQVLNAIQFCMRSMQYSHELSLRSIKPAYYIEKGDLLHKMLETYYNMRKYRMRWMSNRLRRDSGPVTHADVVDICVRVGRHYMTKLQLDMNDCEATIVAFREYCTFRADDKWDKIIAVEQTGSFILFENEEYKVIYQVKIDLILELQNMPICGVDHKSTSRRSQEVIGPDGSTFPPEALLNQFMGYCVALGTNNFIKNEIGFQKSLKAQDKFIRKFLSYSNDNLEEWKAEAAWWLIRAQKDGELGFYPRNLTSCDKYSGCAYRYVCKADRSLRPTKLAVMFETKKKWDVGVGL